jgi:hypothetical protein
MAKETKKPKKVEKTNEVNKIDRRKFLKTASIAPLAMASTGAVAASAKTNKDESEEFVQTYSRGNLFQARQAYLNRLASFSGGQLIPGCCTQGCCGDDNWAIGLYMPLYPPPYPPGE